MAMSNSAQTILDHPKSVILVVDDEALIRANIADYLRDCGYVVHEAGDATDAIACLSEPGGACDVVFTDINMPGSLDGLGLAKWVKANRPQSAVILTSGRLAQTPGDCTLLAKPYAPEQVVECIEEVVRGKNDNNQTVE